MGVLEVSGFRAFWSLKAFMGVVDFEVGRFGFFRGSLVVLGGFLGFLRFGIL